MFPFQELERRAAVSLPREIVKLLLGTGQMSTTQLHDVPTAVDQSAADFKTLLISLIPQLRAFATVLCRNRELAEDLAQEALVKAWRAQNSFEPGSNLKAWLFTILRNEFMTNQRRSWRQV